MPRGISFKTSDGSAHPAPRVCPWPGSRTPFPDRASDANHSAYYSCDADNRHRLSKAIAPWRYPHSLIAGLFWLKKLPTGAIGSGVGFRH